MNPNTLNILAKDICDGDRFVSLLIKNQAQPFQSSYQHRIYKSF